MHVKIKIYLEFPTSYTTLNYIQVFISGINKKSS